MNNEPVAWMYAVNGIWTAFSDELPPDDAYDEGTLTPLYTHPAKEKYLSLQKVDGELVAVTYTDDEHRIIEVLWERPPAKTLTDEEILQEAENMFGTYFFESIDDPYWIEFARAILRKAQEK